MTSCAAYQEYFVFISSNAFFHQSGLFEIKLKFRFDMDRLQEV